MSGTYWSLQDCAWVACDGQREACADPLGVVDDVLTQASVPAPREPVPVPVDA